MNNLSSVCLYLIWNYKCVDQKLFTEINSWVYLNDGKTRSEKITRFKMADILNLLCRITQWLVS